MGKGVKDLASYLKRLGVEAELLEFSGTVRTVKDAVRQAGVEASDIVKSLVAVCDGEPMCFIVPGDRRLSVVKVRRTLGCREVRLAKPVEVLELTGYSVGGMPPVGHGLKTIVDRAVLEKPLVIGGGGDEQHLLKIAPSQVVRLTNARVEDIAE